MTKAAARRRRSHHGLGHGVSRGFDTRPAGPLQFVGPRIDQNACCSGSGASARASAWPTWPAPNTRTGRLGGLGRPHPFEEVRRTGSAAARSKRHVDPPAAALTDLRARAECRASASCAPIPQQPAAPAAIIMEFERAAADRADAAPSAETSMNAPASRGAEPRTSRNLDQHRPPRDRPRKSAMARSARAHGVASRAARRSTAISTRSGVTGVSSRGQIRVVGDARHRHRQRLDHRDRQHQRRLADRLGAADGRLLD